MTENNLIPIDTLIVHGTVLTMDEGMRVIADGAVAVAGKRIAAVGEAAELAGCYRAAETIDARGMIVMPGLINTHTHSGDALFRGLVEDLALEEWLAKLWVVEGEFLRPETVAWGARLAYLEMIRGGTTTAVDMFWFPDTLAEAARAAGFRIVTGTVYFDSPMTDGIQAEQRGELARAFIAECAVDGLVIPCVQPHGVYTVSPQYLRQAAEIAAEYGILFSTHASETRAEVENCLAQYGATPMRHLDQLGALTPRTILAHCVHLEADEFDLLAQRGVTVAHCPVSNLKLASGIAEVGKMLAAGVKVTLGTDGPVSGNDLNLWAALRLAAILHKTVNRDPALLPTRQMVRMVTCDAARALGLDDRIGSLAPGKLADLILVRAGGAHNVPSFDPYAMLVYSVGREDVDTVLIDGRVVLRQGTVTTLDEKEVLDAISDLAVEIELFTHKRT